MITHEGNLIFPAYQLNSVDKIFSNYDVIKASVFGSFAKQSATSNSDVDMLVEFSKPVGVRFFGLKEELETVFNRPVDLFRFSDMERSSISDQVIGESKVIYVHKA